MNYGKIKWGLIFMIDFRLNGFDILPDFIGYMLFFIGLSKLQEKNDYFKKAKYYSLLMIPISLMNFYDFEININMEALFKEPMAIALILLILLELVIRLLIIYNICSGIGYESELIENYSLTEIAEKRRNIYLISVLFVNILPYFGFSLEYEPFLIILFLVLAVISITSFFLILDLFNIASEEL